MGYEARLLGRLNLKVASRGALVNKTSPVRRDSQFRGWWTKHFQGSGAEARTVLLAVKCVQQGRFCRGIHLYLHFKAGSWAGHERDAIPQHVAAWISKFQGGLA